MNYEEIGCPNYSIGLAHIILSGASGWAIQKTNTCDQPITFGCFCFIFGHSFLGLLRYTHPAVSQSIAKLHNLSHYVVIPTTLALINTEFHVQMNQPKEYSWSLLASALMAPFSEIMVRDSSEMVVDMVIASNIASLTYLSAIQNNFWGIGLAFIACMNNFFMDTFSFEIEMPKIALKTVGLAFFTICAAKIVIEQH